MVGHQQPRRLPRREFLRHVAMATTAAAAATTAYGAVLRGNLSAARDAVPRLNAEGPVRGVTAVRDRLFAVGNRSEGPAVWRCGLGDQSWSLSADGRSFPPGTVLSAVGAIGARLLAVGEVRRVSRVQTLIDGRTGAPVSIPIVGNTPAIFSSVDGVRWASATPPGDTSGLGAFTHVAATDDDTKVLAVGSTFREPGVAEAYGLLAASSADGRTWTSVRLPGVQLPRHGAPTLLARAGRETVLGIRDAEGTRLHATSGGSWRLLPAPSALASFLAAGTMDGALLVAGIDDSGDPKAWERTPRGWLARELPGVPSGGVVLELAELGGGLVAAGSVHGRGFVVRIGG